MPQEIEYWDASDLTVQNVLEDSSVEIEVQAKSGYIKDGRIHLEEVGIESSDTFNVSDILGLCLDDPVIVEKRDIDDAVTYDEFSSVQRQLELSKADCLELPILKEKYQQKALSLNAAIIDLQEQVCKTEAARGIGEDCLEIIEKQKGQLSKMWEANKAVQQKLKARDSILTKALRAEVKAQDDLATLKNTIKGLAWRATPWYKKVTWPIIGRIASK